jgi:uncharacterized protein YjdB
VSLNKSTTTIAIGGTETLTATEAPTNATNQNVTWYSLNSTVASVSPSGVVTGIAAGTAAIEVRTVDGNYMAACAVTVTSTVVPVTSVSLKTTTSIVVGGTETLAATVAPANATNQNVTWFSRNTAVATVSPGGAVTGISVGTTIIDVFTVDGSKTAPCTVTVLPQTADDTGSAGSTGSGGLF